MYLWVSQCIGHKDTQLYWVFSYFKMFYRLKRKRTQILIKYGSAETEAYFSWHCFRESSGVAVLNLWITTLLESNDPFRGVA